MKTTFRAKALKARATREGVQKDPPVAADGGRRGRYGGRVPRYQGAGWRSSGPSAFAYTPLSEGGLSWGGLGAALNGLRPIVEVMTVNFSLLAADQIRQQRATLLPHGPADS